MTRNSNGGEWEAIFRMVTKDIQGNVGTLKLVASPLRISLNAVRRIEAKLLTDEILHGLFFELPPRIPPPGEQFSHALELGSCRSQFEEVPPSRVADLFRGLRSRFKTDPTRHKFEKLVKACGPFYGIEFPTCRNRVLCSGWGGIDDVASFLAWVRGK